MLEISYHHENAHIQTPNIFTSRGQSFKITASAQIFRFILRPKNPYLIVDPNIEKKCRKNAWVSNINHLVKKILINIY